MDTTTHSGPAATLPNQPPTYTLHDLAKSIRPEWAGEENWSLRENWMCWPPDMFALLSIVLERTGCYKICLLEYDWWQRPGWQADIQKAADYWICNTTDLLNKGKTNGFCAQPSKVPKLLNEQLSVLEPWSRSLGSATSEEEIVNIDDLRVLTYERSSADSTVSSDYNLPKAIESRRAVARALVTLYAIADNACIGFGLPEKYQSQQAPAAKFMHALANLLLTATGSLSTLPKFHGVVLPKMRTPQAGQMIRSLSHHLTFHTTEVEVVWRTIPWPNHHQKTLNILALPFPFEVREANFQVRSERFHSVQYFSYVSTPDIKTEQDNTIVCVERIVELVWEQCCQLDQVHILVFPETALSEAQYQQLLNSLKKRFEPDPRISDADKQGRLYQLPLIVAGVYKGEPTLYQGVEKDMGHNEVRVATFFAGRWYDIAQRKHHRWQLDRSQIIQYQLEGKLPTERKWFEHISVSQRRLTVLAPTGWLTLTSLICEDLARLEPVSELIRGIGPTLLMALLSDGPQKNHRWSARYASVLADDPGTAVLTLTSLGMATRSKRLNSDLSLDEKTRQSTEPVRHTVGLWKDLITGYRLLEIEEKLNETGSSSKNQDALPEDKAINTPTDKRKRALRITVSARYEEEFTLDGRSDNENAAVFRLDGFESLALPAISPEGRKRADEWITKNDKLRQLPPQSVNSNVSDSFNDTVAPDTLVEADDTFKQGKWNDIRELSALLFTLDSLIELKVASVLPKDKLKPSEKNYSGVDFNSHLSHILSWFITENIANEGYPESLKLVINTLQSALKYPFRHGIDAQEKENETWPSPEIKRAGDRIRELFDKLANKEIDTPIKLYYELVIAAYNLLNKAKFTVIPDQQQEQREEDQQQKQVVKEQQQKERVDYLVPLLVLYTLYSKLSNTPVTSTDAPNERSIPAIVRLRKNIKQVLMMYQSTLMWGNELDNSLSDIPNQIESLKKELNYLTV